MFRKKAMAMWQLVILILGVLSLIFIPLTLNDYIYDSMYEGDILSCQYLFSSIKGKPGYFNSELNFLSDFFYDVVASTCSARSFDVSDDSVGLVAQEIYNCYKKANFGGDFLGANVRDTSICLYCGDIEFKADIDNFDEKLLEELRKDEYLKLFEKSDYYNLNNQTLRAVPKDINKGDRLNLFYRVDVPKLYFKWNWESLVDNFDEISQKLDAFVFSKSSVTTKFNWVISDMPDYIDIFSSVILVEFDDPIKAEMQNDNKNVKAVEGCNVIMPDKIYD